MKIFQMTSSQWWMAETLDEALALFNEHHGQGARYMEGVSPRELTDEEMDRLTIEMGEGVEPLTFREALEVDLSTGLCEPGFFATTNW